MQENLEDFQDLIIPAPSSLVSLSRAESSFDSGYCTSPARLSFINLSSWPLENSPFRMDPKMTVTCRQPFSPQRVVKSEAAESGYLVISPMKNSNESFSPFKNSTLSPFKHSNQSPSKGSFDDWDKDFIASFEENLFGMHDLGDLPDSLVGELLKSPQGKAFLEKRNSPLKFSTGAAARKLRISPQHDTFTRSVIVDVNKSGVGAKTAVVKIKEEPVEFYTVIKEEPDAETELHSEHNYHAGHSSALPVADPEKVSATPSKPGITYDEKTAAKRKLALKAHNDGNVGSAEINLLSEIQQKENFMSPLTSAFHLWPSKDRLRFARAHFKQILDKAVKDKIEKFRARQLLAKEHQVKPDAKLKYADKMKLVKHKSGKCSRKTNKKEKYPQIKKALSKPAVGRQGCDQGFVNSIIPHVKSKASFDPGWYPDDDDSDDDADSWHGSIPFQRQISRGFYDDENDDIYIDVDISSDDEYCPDSGGKKRKKSKKGFGKKKRRF